MNSSREMPAPEQYERLAAAWCGLLRSEIERCQSTRETLLALRAAMMQRDHVALAALLSEREVVGAQTARAAAACKAVVEQTATVLRVAPDGVKLPLLANRCSENTRRVLLELREQLQAAADDVHALRRGNDAMLQQAGRLFSELLAALGHPGEDSERYDASGRRQRVVAASVLEATC